MSSAKCFEMSTMSLRKQGVYTGSSCVTFMSLHGMGLRMFSLSGCRVSSVDF